MQSDLHGIPERRQPEEPQASARDKAHLHEAPAVAVRAQDRAHDARIAGAQLGEVGAGFAIGANSGALRELDVCRFHGS